MKCLDPFLSPAHSLSISSHRESFTHFSASLQGKYIYFNYTTVLNIPLKCFLFPFTTHKIPAFTPGFSISPNWMSSLDGYDQPSSPSFNVRKWVKFSNYLKNLFPGDLNTTMASLRLLLRQLLPQDLEFLHEVSLVPRHGQTLCLVWQLTQGHYLLLLLVLLIFKLILAARNKHSCLQALKSYLPGFLHVFLKG